MHGILIKKGLRQLYAIGSGTESSVLYSAAEGKVSRLMSTNFTVAALHHCQLKGAFSVTNHLYQAPSDTGAFVSMLLNSWVAQLPYTAIFNKPDALK